MARRGAPQGLPIGARSDGVPRPASWGAPKPGHPDPASTVGVDVGVRWLAAIRRHEIPRLTTRPATPHGRIVGEGLDAAGRLRQKGLPGARARRRGPAEAALAELRRQLRYQVGWYGSEVVEAERYLSCSRLCHGCGLVQDLGGDEHWTCKGGGARHRRDDHAAINLARYSPGAPHQAGLVGAPPDGSVGASVRRRAASGDPTKLTSWGYPSPGRHQHRP